MRLNTASSIDAGHLTTHESGIADRISPEQQLRRTVMTCFLWEKGFYESGEEIATRI